MRAHLHGGVPKAEVDALDHFWTNYPGLRARVFTPRQDDAAYLDFAPEVTDRRALAEIVNDDTSIADAHRALSPPSTPGGTTPSARSRPSRPERRRTATATAANVYALRRTLLASIEAAFAGTTLLTRTRSAAPSPAISTSSRPTSNPSPPAAGDRS